MLLQTDVVRWFSIVVFVFNTVSGYSERGCLLNVTNESTEKYLPVPFFNYSTQYELVIPFKGAVSLKTGDKIVLLCHGPSNYLTLTNSNITSASCLQRNTIQIFRKNVQFEDIQCNKVVKGKVLKTREKCGFNQGRIFKIGYQVTKTNWVTLIDVCYVPEIGITLFTQHTIHGKAMKYASKSRYRPSFDTSGLNSDVTASLAFKRAYQKATFNKILRSAKIAESYINEHSFLARGHLSPDADFLLATAQYSTYFYINTAPQWQEINGGNWKSVESLVRKLSEPYENLLIFTGTYTILTYQDADDIPKPIFLVSESKLPVPKYFWKIVYDEKTQKGVAFVVLNDPFLKKVNRNDIFCEDICENHGYTNSAWRKIDRGYVFCCEVGDFQSVVKVAPKLRVKQVLSI